MIKDLYIVSDNESDAIEAWKRWAFLDSIPYQFEAMCRVSSNILLVQK